MPRSYDRPLQWSLQQLTMGSVCVCCSTIAAMAAAAAVAPPAMQRGESTGVSHATDSTWRVMFRDSGSKESPRTLVVTMAHPPETTLDMPFYNHNTGSGVPTMRMLKRMIEHNPKHKRSQLMFADAYISESDVWTLEWEAATKRNKGAQAGGNGNMQPQSQSQASQPPTAHPSSFSSAAYYHHPSHSFGHHAFAGSSAGGSGGGTGAGHSNTAPFSPNRGFMFYSLSTPQPGRKLTAHCMDSDDDLVSGLAALREARLSDTVAIGATDDEAVTFPTEEEMAAMMMAAAGEHQHQHQHQHSDQDRPSAEGLRTLSVGATNDSMSMRPSRRGSRGGVGCAGASLQVGGGPDLPDLQRGGSEPLTANLGPSVSSVTSSPRPPHATPRALSLVISAPEEDAAGAAAGREATDVLTARAARRAKLRRRTATRKMTSEALMPPVHLSGLAAARDSASLSASASPSSAPLLSGLPPAALVITAAAAAAAAAPPSAPAPPPPVHSDHSSEDIVSDEDPAAKLVGDGSAAAARFNSLKPPHHPHPGSVSQPTSPLIHPRLASASHSTTLTAKQPLTPFSTTSAAAPHMSATFLAAELFAAAASAAGSSSPSSVSSALPKHRTPPRKRSKGHAGASNAAPSATAATSVIGLTKKRAARMSTDSDAVSLSSSSSAASPRDSVSEEMPEDKSPSSDDVAVPSADAVNLSPPVELFDAPSSALPITPLPMSALEAAAAGLPTIDAFSSPAVAAAAAAADDDPLPPPSNNIAPAALQEPPSDTDNRK